MQLIRQLLLLKLVQSSYAVDFNLLPLEIGLQTENPCLVFLSHLQLGLIMMNLNFIGHKDIPGLLIKNACS